MEEDLLTALNVRFASRGIKLEFRDGDLWIGSRSTAEEQRFEAEYGGMVRQLRAILRGEFCSPQ
jgi:hypothetical protein